jgi:POT family proton-dependent oligopeptide transporter
MVSSFPRTVLILSVVEFWERFSFYSVMGLLPLFLVTSAEEGGAGWVDAEALQLTAAYTGIAFMLPLAGGWVASRWVGERAAVLLGGSIIVLGHLLLGRYASDRSDSATPVLYAAVAALVLGTGLLKPSISALIGLTPALTGRRRDEAFMLFMTAISCGAITAGIVSGMMMEYIGWSEAFLTAAAGMPLALLFYVLCYRQLPRRSDQAARGAVPKDSSQPAATECASDRRGVPVIVAMSFMNAVYAAFFFQYSGLLSLIAERATDRMIFAFEVPAAWMLSVPVVVFVALAPLTIQLFRLLDRRGVLLNVFQKQGVGFMFLAAAFFVFGASALARDAGAAFTPVIVSLAGYGLMGFADLATQPAQISAATTYSPPGQSSFWVGVWMLGYGSGAFAAGYLGSLSSAIGIGPLLIGIAVLSLAAAVVCNHVLAPMTARISGAKAGA